MYKSRIIYKSNVKNHTRTTYESSSPSFDQTVPEIQIHQKNSMFPNKNKENNIKMDCF